MTFKASDITGMKIGGEFALTDHTGKARTLSDFKGKVVVLFFGYTHCPDVCPTTLSEVDAALKELGTLVATGRLKYRETIAQGIESAPEAFLGLLKGRNFGKQLVRL